MGGQQSARRLSVDNDEPSNVIKVSEKVVERLKGSVEGETPNPPRSTSSSSTVHIQPRQVKDDYDDVGLSTSLEVKKKYEEEIAKNNEYWENRIKDLQQSHQRINETWEKEYKRAIDEVEKSFPKGAGKDQKLPCSAQKTVVLDCYKKNSAQPLLCANEVQAFSDCMNNIRNSSKD